MLLRRERRALFIRLVIDLSPFGCGIGSATVCGASYNVLHDHIAALANA